MSSHRDRPKKCPSESGTVTTAAASSTHARWSCRSSGVSWALGSFKHQTSQRQPNELHVGTTARTARRSIVDTNNNSLTANGGGVLDPTSLEKKNRSITCLRVLVLLTLVIATALVASLTYVYVSRNETSDFRSQYEDSVVKVASGFQNGVDVKAWAASTFSAMYTSRYGGISPAVWPNATMPHFQEQANGQLKLANGRALSFNPIIQSNTRAEWEAHATESASIMGSQSLIERQSETARVVADGIFSKQNGEIVNDPGYAPGSKRYPYTMVPVWQIAPILTNEKAVMFNLHAETNRQRALDDMMEYGVPTLTAILQLVQDKQLRPSSILFYPVFGSYDKSSPNHQDVVGSISIVFSWDDVLRQLLPNYIKGMICVLESSIGQTYTYSIAGESVNLLGEGDLHDGTYQDMEYIVDANLEGTSEVLGDVDFLITYRLRIYPSEELENQYVSQRPVIYTIGVILIFLCTAGLFLLYDYLVKHRQKMVSRAAERSGKIVESLFPAAFRDRLFQNQEQVQQQRNLDMGGWRGSNHSFNSKNERRQSSLLSTGSSDRGLGRGPRRNSMSSMVDLPTYNMKKFLKKVNRTQTSRPDFNVGDNMGKMTADQSTPIADLFPATSIMFCDLVGFTAWCSSREPNEVFQLLEMLFWEFDQLASEMNVFKLGTIGDCYIAVTGLPEPTDDHALIIADFAIACQRKVTEVLNRLADTILETSQLGMRFGLHSGPVTAGILRGHKSRFELFGDTINTASRMESTGVPNKIQVSSDTADLLREGGMGHCMKAREELVEAKGKGKLQTYWLVPSERRKSMPAEGFGITRMKQEWMAGAHAAHKRYSDCQLAVDDWNRSLMEMEFRSDNYEEGSLGGHNDKDDVDVFARNGDRSRQETGGSLCDCKEGSSTKCQNSSIIEEGGCANEEDGAIILELDEIVEAEVPALRTQMEVKSVPLAKEGRIKEEVSSVSA